MTRYYINVIITLVSYHKIGGLGGRMKQWTIIYRSRYSAWFEKCGEDLQDEILAHLEVLKVLGPTLGRPRVDHIKGSVRQNMKELRIQFKGDPVRILFAFDPDRQAVLLLGGSKVGDKRWYDRNIPLADNEFTLHLKEMTKGLRKDKEKEKKQ